MAGFGIVEVASAQSWLVAGGLKWLQMVQSNRKWLQVDEFSQMWMVSGGCIMVKSSLALLVQFQANCDSM